jgi:hypothetical protein
MMKAFCFLSFALLLTAPGLRADEPVLRTVKTAQPGENLLKNDEFELGAGNKLAGWSAARDGFIVAQGQGRNGSQAMLCDNATETTWAGASQTLVLNRTNVSPLVISGWSKAENVSGGSDSDYSLYVDILYTDGTPLWGQTARFHAGTHDWQRRELVILPAKPVQTVTLHCLLRKHSGRAWFDDVTLQEVAEQEGALLFQGVPMSMSRGQANQNGKSTKLATQDGLEISLRDDVVTALKVSSRDVRSEGPSGFLVRDAAANSDVYGFHDEQCPELGLKLRTIWKAERNHLVAEGRISDLSGKDRAITLLFALPIDAAGWRWGDDVRRSRTIEGRGEFANSVVIGCGATGTMSLYPLTPVFSDSAGVAIGLDMAQPAQFRLGYQAGLKQLYIAYDFGLVPESVNFPRGADFRFVLFEFDPHWGFRGAFQKYTEIFPEHFKARSHDQGIWMPFTDVSTVEGWQDFGFKYHEGNNNVSWDDAHGILSFRYTEPMTWWMGMKKGTPRTVPEALQVRNDLAQSNDRHQRRMAQVSTVAAMWDESGQPDLIFRNEPWCDGAVWSLNPNPWLRVASGSNGAAPAPPEAPVNAATVYWNDELKQSLYGQAAKGIQDGEYLDSIEGYVTADLNYRREHFRHTTVTLSFDAETKQPALYKGLAVFEFTKWLSADVHSMGKLMFANGVPYRFAWLCPWLDVLGTETDWLSGGKYRPASDVQMCLWRTLSGQKPYLLLMNTDYNAFSPELVELYFQRSLFYGMFPSMFSHNASENPYWQNRKWYNRDRPLFKKYQPLIKQIAEAGWQPVTYAHCDNPQIWVERFGTGARGAIYFTLFNDSTTVQKGFLRADCEELHLNPDAKADELVSGSALRAAPAGWEIELRPQEAKAVELR